MDIVVVKDLDFYRKGSSRCVKKEKTKAALIAAIIIIATIANLAVWVPFKLEKDYLAKVGRLTKTQRAKPGYSRLQPNGCKAERI